MIPKVPEDIADIVQYQIEDYRTSIKKYNSCIKSLQVQLEQHNIKKEKTIQKLHKLECFAKEMRIKIDEEKRA